MTAAHFAPCVITDTLGSCFITALDLKHLQAACG